MVDPMTRIDAADAVFHPFFNEADKIPSESSGLSVSLWGQRDK